METVTSEGGSTTREAPWCCRLTIVYPPELRAVIDLDDAPRTLGRQPEPPLGLGVAHSTVSRRHLELRWDARIGRHIARDLGSRNGSQIHGAPLGPIPRVLDDNAVIRFGDILAVYERQRGPLVDGPAASRSAIPGDALALVSFRAALARAAQDPSPALILGESGSGKERSAAELHRQSGRPGPFLALNCAALSPQLIESQLFGHQRGAFTGATTAQPGLFRAADNGTLFLDEIGELPLDLQPKLLRVLESGELLPLGSTQIVRVNVRVVAATNRVLADEVEAGRFRRDLYARLALWELHLPPLARRRVDILPWLDRLAADWAAARGLARPPRLELTPSAASAILRPRWPENLRGLLRLVHELAHRGPGPVHLESLPAWLQDDTLKPAAPEAAPAPAQDPAPEPLRELRPRPSRSELIAALIAHDWNLSATARAYERDRKQISRWITMYDIETPGSPGE
jgi:DNA-binding NtrC family response regulator